MAKIDELERGTQVVYVPNHAIDEWPADGPFAECARVYEMSHPDCEEGFVTSTRVSADRRKEIAFCRFWSKDDPTELRTTANSEACYPRNLVVKDTRPQEVVDAKLAEIAEEERRCLKI